MSDNPVGVCIILRASLSLVSCLLRRVSLIMFYDDDDPSLPEVLLSVGLFSMFNDDCNDDEDDENQLSGKE